MIKNRDSDKFIINSTLFHRAMVNVTDVEITRDLLKAKVYWDCISPYHSSVEKELNETDIVSKIRKIFTSKMNMKYSPELIFKREGKEDYEMEAMMEKATEEFKMLEKMQSLGDLEEDEK